MDIPIVRPKALKPGDRIAVVAPAGPVEDPLDLHKGVAALERMGFRVEFDERIFRASGYLAGSDEERTAELVRAFVDPEIMGVVALRGGYGCSRIIHLLDQGRLRSHCKVFMGFSDLTTLHMFFRRRFGWVTFHGPMAASPTLGNISPEQQRHLFALWTDPAYLPSLSFPELQAWSPGTAEGELTGGCLSLITASLGTPYELHTSGKILFLEDLGEAPYRIDRMLTQLLLAQKLDQIAGVLLGTFRDCDPGKSGVSVEEVLKDLLCRLKVPVIAGFPSGHGPANWVLPLGSKVSLDASIPRVRFLEGAVDS
jgi:muramoyltetrapeptide carboxypeptidase